MTQMFHELLDSPPLPIAARKVKDGTYAERYTIVPAAEVLYAFSGPAPASGLIEAPWINTHSFRRGHVYVRTDAGVFFVHCRSLAELTERLKKSRNFFPLNHSVFVRLHDVAFLDLDGKLTRVGIQVKEHTEWLTVSRRRISDLREVFALPRRGENGKNGHKRQNGKDKER